jgi:hypothetical protein
MSKDANDKDSSDIEKEFEKELKKEKRPEESLLPEETDFEREYDEEMQGERPPKKKEIDPIAQKFYELSTRKFKTDTELDNAVNTILNEIEREYFFKGLLAKTGKGGKFLLKKGVATFPDLSAFEAANAITQLARGNLKGTLGTLAKTGIKRMQAGTTIPMLKALGFEAGGGTELNRAAWQNFTNVCKGAFDNLARNLNEKGDDPLVASKLASDAFGFALKKVVSELRSVSVQKTRKLVAAAANPSPRKFVNRTVTLALGLICIVLAAGIIGVIAYYAPMGSTLDEKDRLISSMNATITNLNATIINLQSSINQSSSSISNYKAQIDGLNVQLNRFYNYLILNMSDLLAYNDTLYQEAGGNTTLYYDALQYAGYVTVQVESTSNTTYVRLSYSAYGVNFDSNMTVGTGGTVAFPVLPSIVYLMLGNTDTGNDTIAAYVTATYTY